MKTIPSPTAEHLLIDLWECSGGILDDQEKIEEIFSAVVDKLQVTEVCRMFRKFTPSGVSGVIVIAESHLSIHTWPDEAYAAIDFYTCGSVSPRLAIPVIAQMFGARLVETRTLSRGCPVDNFKVLGDL
jgi:S-adenosylmethionine decarboxylase proenzyme